MTIENLSDNGPESGLGFNNFVVKNLKGTLGEDYFSLTPSVTSSLDILPKLKLDLTPDGSTNGGASSSRSNATVLAVLNKCRTVSGQRLLTMWLQNPLKSEDKIKTRLDIVQFLAQDTHSRSLCYDDALRKIPDLLRIAFKIEREKCNINDLMKVFQACQRIRTLCCNLRQSIDISGSSESDAVIKLIEWIKKSCHNLQDFNVLIEESIDLNEMDENNQYMVRPDSDENIARVTLDVQRFCDEAKGLLQAVADDVGLEAEKSIKLEIDADKGFGFKVTKNNESAIRGNKSFEQLSLVKKDGYRFTNKKLSRLSNKYVDAKAEYNSLAKNVIQEVISKAVMYGDEVLEFTIAVTVLDTFVGLAVAAVQNNYSRPLILPAGSGRIRLDKMRHPCIENQPDIENYVPNDLTMDKASKSFFLITGPNMGGKSTFIKSAGICCIMAQCGSLIPASDGVISLVDGVYTRVGASDRQAQGISTFMEEMMDMAVILKNATEHSFVIIDELGRGTSTFDGFGLAWSISRELAANIKCYTLFATHFHELTEMEETVPSVGNLHVKAICQQNSITMLYNVERGVCDESYGINVAQYTRFPEHVVEMARNKLKQFEEVSGFGSKKEVRDFVRSCVRDHMATSQTE